MIEIPESFTIARQLNEHVKGKRIVQAHTAHTPHGFAFYSGYWTLLSKLTVGKPCPYCGSNIQKASYLGGTVYFCPECQE
ncbi:MAG: hypothetical protein K2P07_07815 [Lachnospiraceae bacterium]|nr:hypothetical protein [Lachnospiraceae bacterium]